jgi:tRNA G10  N-methylase Trm11
MSKQYFKNIYFSDYPVEGKNSLSLAFGEKYKELYQNVEVLSSEELRKVLGYDSFEELEEDAKNQNSTINNYTINIISERIDTIYSADNQEELFNDSDLIAPIQATFRGGSNVPLHTWFNYLEGYSPEFVKNVYNQFLVDKNFILDPFAGVGTTPITLAQNYIKPYYCELNPALREVISTKILCIREKKRGRNKILKKINELKDNLSELISESEPNAKLEKTFKDTFGSSKYFDKQVFEKVLKSKNLLNSISKENATVGKLFNLAVLSSLIPSSNLIRRGDIRFLKGDEKEKHKEDFEVAIKNQLEVYIRDLNNMTTMGVEPTLICNNAKDISEKLDKQFDGIITSPPYLNGTNYFRNTKLELWYLGDLEKKSDLRDFRLETVTGGINDVLKEKKATIDNPLISELVSKLEVDAYDKRIPQMVKLYFSDMKKVFKNLKPTLKNDAKLIIDIGDSVYCGIHVSTHRILINVFENLGYKFEREIKLRQRLSRSGQTLKQVLLIFNNNEPVKQKKKPEKDWEDKWKYFKEYLPYQSGDYAKRNWGHGLHSLCSYQGKMKPSISHHLIKTFLKPGDKMLDPFAGVGTIPFEGALAGVKSYGFDISPSAYIISKAKLSNPDPQKIYKLIEELSSFIKSNSVSKKEIDKASKIDFNQSLVTYYHSDTFEEILLTKKYFGDIKELNNSEAFVFSAVLHILHGNRPYALSRRSHPITPFAPKGDYEYRPLIPRLKSKVERSLKLDYPKKSLPGQVFLHDCTRDWPQDIQDLDAIITSPPFYDSTRFYLSNWIRLWFSGWELNDFKTRPKEFIDERQKENLSIYDTFFKFSKERLKKNGLIVMHLGKSSKCNMGEEIRNIAQNWFDESDLFDENVAHCETHGISDKGTVTDHQYLVLYD